MQHVVTEGSVWYGHSEYYTYNQREERRENLLKCKPIRDTREGGSKMKSSALLRHRRVCVCIARYHRQLLCTSPNASVAIVILLLLFSSSSSSSWSFICVTTCMNGTNNEQDLRLELAGNSDSKDISFSYYFLNCMYIYSTFTSVMYSRRWAHSRQWPTTVKAVTACCSVTVLYSISGKDIQSFRKTAFQLAIGLLRFFFFFFFLVVVVVDPPTVS